MRNINLGTEPLKPLRRAGNSHVFWRSWKLCVFRCIIDYMYHQITCDTTGKVAREKTWVLTVLFVFCFLSEFKDIPSECQYDHCEWIFRLVWFPQSWRYIINSINGEFSFIAFLPSQQKLLTERIWHLWQNFTKLWA